jgi:hypothetical protein
MSEWMKDVSLVERYAGRRLGFFLFHLVLDIVHHHAEFGTKCCIVSVVADGAAW